MTDYISRQAMIDRIKGTGYADQIKENFLFIARMLPSAPVREVVTCGECKNAHMTADGKLCKYCDQFNDDYGHPTEVYFDADFFCSYAERKSDVHP